MTLSEKQNKELDSLKNKIETIERNIDRAKTSLGLAEEFEDYDKINTIDKAIVSGIEQINNMVKVQAESMKLEFNLVMDLIFDREYTLQVLNTRA